MIYLNDNFEGGETVFYTEDETSRTKSGNEEICTIVPKQGMMLVFDIGLKHKGNEVKSKEKYWFGFEVLRTLDDNGPNTSPASNKTFIGYNAGSKHNTIGVQKTFIGHLK